MEVQYQKVRTGIPGFDSIISGGFRDSKTIVLSGTPGSGKTTFGMQFLQYGALDFDEPGVFVTLVQSPQELIEDFMAYGWDVQGLIEQEKMVIIDARPFKTENGFVVPDESLYSGEELPFMHLTQLMVSSIKKIKAKRLVVDSLSILNMQYSNQFYGRQGLQGMIHALEDQKCTSILISENPELKTPPEWYVASGIIMLNREQVGTSVERTLQVIKMRGVKHSEQIFPIEFDDGGYKVLHPQLLKQ